MEIKMTVQTSSTVRAIGYALAGFLFWVTGDSFMKLAGTSTVPKYEIMAIGGITGMICIFVITFLRGRLKHLKPKKYRSLGILTVWFLVGYVLFFNALMHLPLANFYAVIFLSPALIAGYAVLFLGEKLHMKQWFAIGVGFVGVIIAVRPTSLISDHHSVWGYVLTLVAMVTLSAQMLSIRIIGKSESRECMAFYPRLGPILAGLAATAYMGFTPIPLRILAFSMFLGFAGGVGWLLIAQAYKMAPAGIVAPFQYMEIIFGIFYGFMIWGEVPTRHVLAGATIIILSGIYIARHAQKRTLPMPISEITP